MSRQFWIENGNSPSLGSGSALASSTTLTDISPLPQYTPPQPLYPGQRFQLIAYGRFSNTGTPNLTIAFYWGGAASGTLLAGTAATATASGVTGVQWRASYNFRVASVGTSGTIVGEGSVDLGTSLTATTGIPIPSTNANPVTINTSLTTITVAAQWGTSSASNTITCEDFIVNILN